MRAASSKERGKASFTPNEDQMWALWVGCCMDARCHRDAASQFTVQLHWRQEPSVWAFCEGHALGFLDAILGFRPYYLEVQPWGTWQPTLPFD